MIAIVIVAIVVLAPLGLIELIIRFAVVLALVVSILGLFVLGDNEELFVRPVTWSLLREIVIS